MRFFSGTLFGACLLAGLLAAGPMRHAQAQSAATDTSRLDQSKPSRPPLQPSAQATEKPANVGTALALTGPEQRIALVIGNSKYQNTVRLSNPANDTKAVAQLLSSAGFEVISATDLSHNQMIQAVQEFFDRTGHGGACAGDHSPYTAAFLRLAHEKICRSNSCSSTFVWTLAVRPTANRHPGKAHR